MRIAPAIELTPDQQSILESQARSRSLPARVVERSRIMLLAVARRRKFPAGASASCDWDWPDWRKMRPDRAERPRSMAA